MRIFILVAVLAGGFMASVAHADGLGFGPCKEGFADGTVVRTESRGDLTISEVRVGDRVWSFHQGVGKPGWSKVLRRVDAAKHYKLLSDFTEPGSSAVTKACWNIERAG